MLCQLSVIETCCYGNGNQIGKFIDVPNDKLTAQK